MLLPVGCPIGHHDATADRSGAPAVAGGAAAYAETPADTPHDHDALLVRGPRPGHGLPFLGPNLIEYERAVYRYRAGEVTVYYGEDRLPIDADPEVLQCGPHALQVLEDVGPHRRVVRFDRASGEWLLFEQQPDTGEICPLVESFIERFEFFLEALPPDAREAPFPAVLELG